jgi:hypothetical protein
MFDPATKRFHMYAEDVRREIENNTISTYHYIFGSIASALTQKQATAFSFIVRLLFSLWGPHVVGADRCSIRARQGLSVPPAAGVSSSK